jgi:hypothetical protein
MSGEVLGTERRVFLYGFAIAAAIVAVVNSINVITIQHDSRDHEFLRAAIMEGSSLITLCLFFWVVWLAWRIAPPNVRPRWKLSLHLVTAPVFSFLHVYGFLQLRVLVLWPLGERYDYGPFLPQFLYEVRKDSLGYLLFVGIFSLVAHLLRPQPTLTETFDIKDGAKLTRVRLDEILAVSSAGNYAEFILADGRRQLMRATLSALADQLAPKGFLRTHRSWLINVRRVTALHPEGSGDYRVELKDLSVPLSRRFSAALAALRDNNF